MGKSALNQPEILPESPPASTPPTPDPAAVAQVSLAGLTAEDILNSNNSQTASPLLRGSLLSLGGLPTPSRSSARHALGVTIVRQPGRRGAGDQVLEPLLYIQVMQPSALLSCHHRKQRMELSVFDVALRGVPSDYKCLGKRDQMSRGEWEKVLTGCVMTTGWDLNPLIKVYRPYVNDRECNFATNPLYP